MVGITRNYSMSASSIDSAVSTENDPYEVPNLTRFAGYTLSKWKLSEDASIIRSRFKKRLLVRLTRETPQFDSLLARLDTISWAREFIKERRDSGWDDSFDCREAKRAYHEDANIMTKQLDDLVNCFFYTRLRNCFRRRIQQSQNGNGEDPARRKAFSLEETRQFSTQLERRIRNGVERDYKYWAKEYKETYDDVHGSETWRRLGERVVTFCRYVGCPNVPDDVHAALDALRSYNSSLRDPVTSRLQERLDERDTKIRKLEDQLQLYQQVITSLSYRSLLETLPEPQHRYNGTQQLISATDHWKDFLGAAIEEANLQKTVGNTGHPLNQINTDDRNSVDGGMDLYSCLSDIIHGFRQNLNELNDAADAQSGGDLGDFTIKSLHFYPSNYNFLKAIKPVSWKDGSVDVEKERERYGVYWDDGRPRKGWSKRKGGFVARSATKDSASQLAAEEQASADAPPAINAASSSSSGASEQKPQATKAREPATTTPPRMAVQAKPPKVKMCKWGERCKYLPNCKFGH